MRMNWPTRPFTSLLMLLVGTMGLSTPSLGEEQPEQQSPPNIVLIIPDDQGYRDFGFMGHPTFKTPHLDRLASQSALFVNGYVPASLCRPSLVSILTGLYPHQHKVSFNDPPPGVPRQQAEHFVRDVPTIPRILDQAGYVSLQTGKFWEGNFANGGFSQGMTHGDPDRVEKHPTLRNLRGRHGDKGLTIGRDTMQPIFDFIDQNQQKPFLVWYAPMMPHTPYTAPQKYHDLYAESGLHPNEIQYAAMITWFDDTVGQLLGYLEEKGLADNTLVVLVTDNGWITSTATSKMTFAPKSKRSPNEMGIRTPMLFRWPGKIKPARYDELVSSIDVFPTVLAASGVQPKEKLSLPGVNLLPLLEGKSSVPPHHAVFGDIYEHDAGELGRPDRDLLYRWVRRGDYKLIVPTHSSEPVQLYDLSVDPDENHNLASDPKEASTLASLKKELDAWYSPKP